MKVYMKVYDAEYTTANDFTMSKDLKSQSMLDDQIFLCTVIGMK